MSSNSATATYAPYSQASTSTYSASTDYGVPAPDSAMSEVPPHNTTGPASGHGPVPDAHQHQQQRIWNVPHSELQNYARPPRDKARDSAVRMSGDLSLTEAWSAFMSQNLDVPGGPGGPPAGIQGRR